MADYNVEYPIVEGRNYFTISSSSVAVSGPLPDLSLQVTFCDDFVRHSKVNLSAVEQPGTAALSELKVGFASEPIRIAYGSVRLSLGSAKDLVRLLTEYIDKSEALLATVQSERKS